MKKLLTFLILFILVIGLSACSEDVEVNNTMTCNYDDSVAVFTYDDDELVSVVYDGEEEKSSEFWKEILDDSYDGNVYEYLDDMDIWYTQSGMFDDAVCVYNPPLEEGN